MGKVIKDNSDELKEHIAVSISETPKYESGKLLGVEKVKSSAGANQAATVHTLLQNWNCSNTVIGLCFDTTSSNTVKFNGAAVLLEQLLRKKLLWLSCRLHIMELIISKVAAFLFGKTTGPEDAKLNEFKDHWSQLDHSEFDTLEFDSEWLKLLKMKLHKTLK